jgi:hypothetical protein
MLAQLASKDIRDLLSQAATPGTRVANSAERRRVGGRAQITGSGAIKTFAIQYKTYNTGSTVGIQDARIKSIRAE